MAGALKQAILIFMQPKKRSSQIQKIVFLVLRPVTKFDIERWGVSHLNRLNIETIVLDLTHLLNNKEVAHKISNGINDPIESESIKIVNSYRQLDSLISGLSKDSLFVDYIHGLSPITIKTARLFRALKKNKAIYGFISDGALPVGGVASSEKLASLRGMGSLIRAIIKDPKRLFNFLINNFIKILARWRLLFPVPQVIFGGNSPILHRFMRERNLNKKILVPINSYDYSVYSEYLKSLDYKSCHTNGTCVFLDEALTHHSDFDILGIKTADEAIYYKAMNLLFRRIEETAGLRVVIAAHPRSSYQDIKNVFDGREIIKGATVDLVAKSDIVVMHMSTSVSYAILFNKPIIAIKIPGLGLDSFLNKQTQIMAKVTGAQLLNIEKDLSSFFPLAVKINVTKYQDYLEKYLLNRNAGSDSTWNIMASKINSISVVHD